MADRQTTSAELAEFFTKYEAVLVLTASYVHTKHARGQLYTKTEDVARWVAHDLPSVYAATFGRGEQKHLRLYRVLSMLSHARFLGAYEALGLRGVPGRGLTVSGAHGKGSVRKAHGARHLRLVKAS